MAATSIIIVEDDPMISEIYERKFKDEGFDVSMAGSGDQALEIAKKKHVDVVLSDLIMPKMDGFELIRNLRGGEYDPNIKIIISSNLSQLEDRDKAQKLGANGFVVKAENTPGELVDKIKGYLHEFREQKKNEYRRANNITENNGKKILMIEDEDVFIDMYGGKLKQEGFAVDAAKTGEEGIRMAQEGHYDAAIVDMIIPGMTGADVIEKLKADNRTKDLPIVAYSASEVGDVVDRAASFGVKVISKIRIIPSELALKVCEACGIEPNYYDGK